jgi:hypothetical protein
MAEYPQIGVRADDDLLKRLDDGGASTTIS